MKAVVPEDRDRRLLAIRRKLVYQEDQENCVLNKKERDMMGKRKG